LLGQYRNWS